MRSRFENTILSTVVGILLGTIFVDLCFDVPLMGGNKDVSSADFQKSVLLTVSYYQRMPITWYAQVGIPILLAVLGIIIGLRVVSSTRSHSDLTMAAALLVCAPYFSLVVLPAEERVVEHGNEDPMAMLDDLLVVGRGHMFMLGALILSVLFQLNDVADAIIQQQGAKSKRKVSNKEK
eukprot:CFRG5446T1